MIKFLVTGQQLKIVTPIVVADTHNYQTAEAVFRGTEWEPCSKWAHFIKDGETYDVPFHSDEITADQSLDLTAGTWQVYIHGNAYDADTDTVITRITTNTAYLKVEAAETESPFPSVTPSFAETLAAEIENAIQVANGVRQDAASGAFNGATFKPTVSTSGDLSWTNDKGLPNPDSVNIKGDPGEPGHGLRILGYYDSLDTLMGAVTDPSPGDAYGIGSDQPYDIYIYDAIGERWINNGSVSGVKGDPGDAATIEIGTVTTVEHNQAASVENVGTSSAARFNFSIPKGYTPKKGTDYWTDSDKQSIRESITPSMIGAVADPTQKSDGQVLAYDKETGKWIAVNMTSGVSSVDGKNGDVVTRLMFTNRSIAANAFTLQSSPKYAGFPYVASKALSGVTAAMAPFVVFSPSDATSGNFCPVVDAYSGGIYIYANSAPSSAITIPLILCMAGDGTLTGMSNSNGLYPGSVTYSKLAEKSVGTSKIADGAVTSAKISDGSVIRSKLAADALYSPVSVITNSSYSITNADSGKTLTDAYSARANPFTFSLTQGNSTNIPIGYEVAIIWRYCTSVTISFSGIRACVPGSGQIATSSSDGSVEISEKFGTIAMKKVESDNTYGDMWIITGNVEVVS